MGHLILPAAHAVACNLLRLIRSWRLVELGDEGWCERSGKADRWCSLGRVACYLRAGFGSCKILNAQHEMNKNRRNERLQKRHRWNRTTEQIMLKKIAILSKLAGFYT